MATISLELFAPYNKAATVMGEFSNWEELDMQKGNDGVFRREVELDDGEFRYKFRVQSQSWFFEKDSWVDVVDPYASKVDDETPPNAVLTIRNGQRVLDDYQWQHDDVPLDPDEALVIYELHVGDFADNKTGEGVSGRFEDVIDRLDYLSDLGVNAIELMPFEEFPGDHSWGYNPRYFFAVESAYGESKDLKHLIDACHARGIRVFKDGVYNHAEQESPLTQIDHDYWFHHEPQDEEHNWGPEFNYEKYDDNLDLFPARKYVRDVVGHWISQFHIDGIRYDAAKQINNRDFMNWISHEAKELAGEKPFINIVEYLPETPEVVGIDGPADACWHESFYHTLKALMLGEEVDLEELKDCLDGRRKGFPATTNLVNYLSNHDHNHIFADLGDKGIIGDEAFKRLKLGTALLFTAIGIPLIWMGQEFGEFSHKTTEPNKLNWQLLENDDNQSLFACYKGLIALRKSNTALQGNNLEFFHDNPQAGVLAFVRWNEEGSRVVTVVNTSDMHFDTYHVPHFPANGQWREWLNAYDVEVHDNTLVTSLAAFEAKVFVI